MDNPYAAPATRTDVAALPQRVASQLWKARLLFWPLGGFWVLAGMLDLTLFFAGPDQVLAKFSTTGLLLMVVEAIVLVCLGGMLIYAGVVAVSAPERAGTLAQNVAWGTAARKAFGLLGSVLSLGGAAGFFGFVISGFFVLGIAAAVHSTGAWLLDQAKRGRTTPRDASAPT